MVDTESKKVKDEYIPQEIWVDHDMKRCDPQRKNARHCTYNAEYELYVIDH